MNDNLQHHGIKGQKWGVRRYQNKNGSLTPAGKKRYNDDEYDDEREAYEKEIAARSGVKYVRKTKKEREAEDAENERLFNERFTKEDAAYKRTEDKMKEVDKKLQSKYDFSSSDDVDKYYKEYDEEWFKILYEERKKEGLSHADLFTLDELYHHGIKGQKWGVRRFQKKDGTLTSAGKKRYDDGPSQKKEVIKGASAKGEKERSKLAKTGKLFIETFAMNIVTDIAGNAIVNAGQAEVGKMLKIGANVYSWYYLGSGLADIYKKDKK